MRRFIILYTILLGICAISSTGTLIMGMDNNFFRIIWGSSGVILLVLHAIKKSEEINEKRNKLIRRRII
jgi:hypothetical protein